MVRLSTAVGGAVTCCMTPQITAGRRTSSTGGAVLKCEGVMKSSKGVLAPFENCPVFSHLTTIFPI